MESSSFATQILSEGNLNGFFPGWGSPRIVALNCSDKGDLKVLADTKGQVPSRKTSKKFTNKHESPSKLNVLFSVSIVGCDLMGSCLYTAGVSASNSGKLAPVGLFLVTVMLYFFRRVYSEVVTAIPVNGGTYNVMLNTASKKLASFVACLSILSYIATAIVSAFDSIVYLALLWPGVDIRIATLLVLFIFGCVAICGVGESAMVSCVMFTMHIVVLTILIVWSFVYGCNDNFQIMHANMQTPFPDVVSSTGNIIAQNSVWAALYFGYCSALLGITGFETASNYVEEMKDPSVFVSTVNWMWVLVGIYNPLISIVSMMVLPMDTIYAHSSDMLAVMGSTVGGDSFHTLICVDAVIILCGGVITSIVGVSSLIKRLASDKVLPSFLSHTNSRGAAYTAIICFILLSMTLFLAIFNPTDPTAINNFGGVFAIAFLCVLCAFGCGAVMMKLHRAKLARLVISKWWQIGISLTAVFLGLVGNIALTPSIFTLFLLYLSGLLLVVIYMFMKVELFSFGIFLLRKMNLTSDKLLQARRLDEAILTASYRQASYNEKNVLLLSLFGYYNNSNDNDSSKLDDCSDDSDNDSDEEEEDGADCKNVNATAGAADTVTGVTTSATVEEEEDYEIGDIVMNPILKAVQATQSFLQVVVTTSTVTSNVLINNVNTTSAAIIHTIRSPLNNNNNDEEDDDADIEEGEEVETDNSKNNDDDNINVKDKRTGRRARRRGGKPINNAAGAIFAWAEGLITNARLALNNQSALYLTPATEAILQRKTEYVEELETMLVKPILGKVLSYFMTSLDNIMSEPFVYLAKDCDPVSLHEAVNYICDNELTNQIYIVHFVDDRETIRKHQDIRTLTKESVRDNRMTKKEAKQYCNAVLLQMFQDGDKVQGHDDNITKKQQMEVKHSVHDYDNNDDDIVIGGSSNETLATTTDGNSSVRGSAIVDSSTTVVQPHTLPSLQHPQNSMLSSSSSTTAAAEMNKDDTVIALDKALKMLPATVQHLVRTVSILDAFYTYKKIHCIVVRGAHFCPSAVDCLSTHLKVTKNNMIMGIPDCDFPFPFAQLSGVRLAVAAPDPVNVAQANHHLRTVLQSSSPSLSSLTSNSPHHHIRQQSDNNESSCSNNITSTTTLINNSATCSTQTSSFTENVLVASTVESNNASDAIFTVVPTVTHVATTNANTTANKLLLNNHGDVGSNTTTTFTALASATDATHNFSR